MKKSDDEYPDNLIHAVAVLRYKENAFQEKQDYVVEEAFLERVK